MKMIWTEKNVQALLVESLFLDPGKRSVGFCPNVRYATVERHGAAWEADLLIVAGSGIVTEVEIKLSRDDFRRDFTGKAVKHAMLAAAAETRQPTAPVPNRLVYAVPQRLGLAEPDVPDWAGLVTLDETGTLRVVKAAPLIHRVRFGQLTDLTTPLSWRLWNYVKGKM